MCYLCVRLTESYVLDIGLNHDTLWDMWKRPIVTAADLPRREFIVMMASIAQVKIFTHITVYTSAYNEGMAAVTLKPVKIIQTPPYDHL